MGKIIAVDFDGTLCKDRWPNIGEPYGEVINECIRRQADGDKIILWTCRSGALLDDALLWCLNRGLKFDAVNDNLAENIEKYGNNCRKVWADEYWDDKNVLVVTDGFGYYGTMKAGPAPGFANVVIKKEAERARKPLIFRMWERIFGMPFGGLL